MTERYRYRWIRYRNYVYYTLYRSCLLIYAVAIVRLLSFLFIDDFEGDANIYVAIKSGSTVAEEGDNSIFDLGYLSLSMFCNHLWCHLNF